MNGPKTLLRAAAVLIASGVLFLAACNEPEPAPDYVARLGDRILTRSEVDSALSAMATGIDSTEAQRQIVEQWVSDALLYEEAERRGLRTEPDVQRLLRESEQSVLISALLAHLYDEVPASPSEAELGAYYERYKDQLRLREPFVRVRYLSTADADSARAALNLMQRARPSLSDNAWIRLVARFAADRQGSLALSSTHQPESRLFSNAPAVQNALVALKEGQISPIIATDSLYTIVQLVERVPAGSTPEMEWIRDELARRLAIQSRKQMYARQVQKLRNEALAREDLVLPEP